MKKLPFTGSGVALVTPFKGLEVNFDALGALIEMHIAHKTDALIICGTSGEASTMPNEEHLEVIRYAVKKTAGRLPVIAGTGSNDTAHAVYLTEGAEKAGADGILSVTPYYNKANISGLLAHFRAIAECCSLPVSLYNVPSRTGMSFSIPVLRELAKIENIVALKEASGSIGYTAQVAAEVPELYLYSGNDDMIVPVMSLGGKGVISVVANILPDETHDICERFLTGDTDGARRLQLDMLELINNLFIEVNPVPIKTAMRILGYEVGNLRLPLGEMSEENREKLAASLKKFNAVRL